MMSWLKRKLDKKNISKKAKEIAEHGEDSVRLELASTEDLKPELLYFFATDESAEVRKALAANMHAPINAKALLSKDEDAKFRTRLAEQITIITPYLDKDKKNHTSELVLEALQNLASDQLPEIRSILSEEIKELENIPAETVLLLARDMEAAISSPVLEFSPLLEDDELMEIIHEKVHDDALAAIAKRQSLNADLAHALAQTENPAAVQALLENKTVEFKDNTLTFIAEKAKDNENWQTLLIERPKLPIDAVKNVASYVSTSLVNQMIENHQLTPETIIELRMAVFERLNKLKGPESKQYQKMRVLLVEEDPAIRRNIEDILTEMGFIDIRSTPSGQKALRIFEVERSPVSLVICSDTLEDSDGIDILKEINEIDKGVLFIMTSISTNTDDINATKQLNVNEYLKKPFKPNDLTKRIQEITLNNR